jgi:hypothetical protein
VGASPPAPPSAAVAKAESRPQRGSPSRAHSDNPTPATTYSHPRGARKRPSPTGVNPSSPPPVPPERRGRKNRSLSDRYPVSSDRAFVPYGWDPSVPKEETGMSNAWRIDKNKFAIGVSVLLDGPPLPRWG